MKVVVVGGAKRRADPSGMLRGLNGVVVSKERGRSARRGALASQRVGCAAICLFVGGLLSGVCGASARAETWQVTGPPGKQVAKLIGRSERGAGLFGYSVALSEDGTTALIGGPNDDRTVGAVWVFGRDGMTWKQQAVLRPREEAAVQSDDGNFGSAVAVSADGNTALIGSPYDHGGFGSAWIFTRAGHVWTEGTARLIPRDETGRASFGWSVALSADGDTALVGGPDDRPLRVRGGQSGYGAVWVFSSGGKRGWAQHGSKLAALGEPKYGDFGLAVAVSGDGKTALVGSSAFAGGRGEAWVFRCNADRCTQQGGPLKAKGEIGAGEFGSAVALSSDGALGLIGGAADNGDRGAAWVFVRRGEFWAQLGDKLIASGEGGRGDFGIRVALSANGETALIGGSSDNKHKGAAWLYVRAGSAWKQLGSKISSRGEEGHSSFGSGVALSRDAGIALISGGDDNQDRGAVWVYIF